MGEGEDALSVAQLSRDLWHRKTVAWSIPVKTAVVALTLLSLNNGVARGTALTDEVRAGFIKGAEENCFDGQSKQAANKSRKPEQIHGLCYCFAEKLSYTMTMEKAIATLGKSFKPTAEEEQVLRAVFDNCWQVNVR
jgi:hypothetical protein